MRAEAGCRLYLITPPTLDPRAFATILAEALAAGDVACVQLRLKDVDDATIEAAVADLKPVTDAWQVPLILNDRPDLAQKTGCDGVHVGQQDTPYPAARRILGDDAIVGVTCHASRDLAMRAAEAGADYVAFGAFFPTATKEAKAHADPDILAWWQEIMTLPCVAIGGITVDNCRPLIDAGADFLAVSASVWEHPGGPAAAVQQFNELFRLTH